MVTWKEFATVKLDLADVGRSLLITAASPKRSDLGRDGRYALQSFPQPKAGSDEFYITGRASFVDDPVARADILRDARHMADASEIAFELAIDRIMHARWENVLTPQMHPVHTKWRAPKPPGAP